MPKFKVRNHCKHCGTWEEYEVIAEDAEDAEMSMNEFRNHKEGLGRLINESVKEV